MSRLDAQEEIYGLSTSLYELGDFQRYVLDCVESWSITPIDSEEFITYSTLQQEFLDKLTDRSKSTPHKARLTALYVVCLHIFRRLTQKLLEIRQYSCVVFMQSDEKSY